MNLSIDSISVKNRQRQSVEVDDHFVESIRRRLIQPIILRQEDQEIILVVGERRLTALKKIGLTELEQGKHFLFLDDLPPDEAEIVELEENVRRSDLSWREHTRAVGKIHARRTETRPDWTLTKTGQELHMPERTIFMYMMVYKNLDSPLLKDADGIVQAHSILQVAAERRAAEIINNIAQAGRQVFDNKEQGTPDAINGRVSLDGNTSIPGNNPDSHNTDNVPSPEIRSVLGNGSLCVNNIGNNNNPDNNPVVCISFLDWLQTYSGPKFNLIHCDFPYGVEYKTYAGSVKNTDQDYETKGFFDLIDIFTINLDKFCSYSAHVLFWFSMEFYEATRQKLTLAGLMVHRHPFVWHKSDNAGIIPGRDNQYPRRVYETAFLCSRGHRPLIRSQANTYAAPLPSNSLHPSQKPEPMLRHFLSMLVDDTTDVFDPTCGSGSALRAAEDLGARKILGLEIDSKYAEAANSATLIARNLRRISKK